MAKNRPTQAQRIIRYMDEHGSITRLESCCELFIFELAARINSLERKGWIFSKPRETIINSYGESKTFVRYSIIKRGEL